MNRIVQSLLIVFAVSAASAGCVSKKAFDEALAQERAKTAADIDAEKQAREAGDQRIQAQIDEFRNRFHATVSSTETGKIEFMVPVHFATNESTVGPEDAAALQKFAGIVQKFYGQSTITLEGFTDPAGSARHNLALSRARANAVRDFLIDQGMPSNQLRIVGYGEGRQVAEGASGDTAGGEMNRRVTFVVETTQPVPPPEKQPMPPAVSSL